MLVRPGIAGVNCTVLGYTGRISRHPVSVQAPDLRQIGDAYWEAFAAGWHVKSFAEHPVFLLKSFSLEPLRSAPQNWAAGRRVDGARANRQRKANGGNPRREEWFRTQPGGRVIVS